MTDVATRLRQRALALKALSRQTITTEYDADLSDEAAAEIERLTVGQLIETAPAGQQMLAWEPNYGWLIVSKQMDGSFLQKSSGNFWMDVPASVRFTHWLPYPGFLKEKTE